MHRNGAEAYGGGAGRSGSGSPAGGYGFGGAGAVSAYGMNGGAAGTARKHEFSSATLDELESQNDEQVGVLTGKVKMLKDVGGSLFALFAGLLLVQC